MSGTPPATVPGEPAISRTPSERTGWRGIDHAVLCVGDLAAAGAAYERLGFTVTPRGDHPWGTANRLVQLEGSFLEILTVADPGLIPEHEPAEGGRGRFSFGAFNRDYLARREGFSMLVFDSPDARADRDEFAAAGLADLEPFDFERTATLPSGEAATVGFSLAFAPPAAAPGAAVFTCRQHAPEHFWNPAYQSHPNGAQRVVEVAMVAEDPEAMRPYFTALHGADAIAERAAGGFAVETPRGGVLVLPPDAYEAQYGEPPRADAPAGPHFAAVRLGVGDLGATQAVLAGSGVATRWAPAGLVVPSDNLFGTALAFAQL